MLNKLKWTLKQLLPLSYRTTYGDENGNKHFVVWNMFFGRCYNIEDYVVVQ
ncbi:MAG: hypothetical protein ABFC34_00605 [Methanobacterium sp.]